MQGVGQWRPAALRVQVAALTFTTMHRLLRTDWMAVAFAVLSSLATPLSAVAHGHDHSEPAHHDHALQQDRDNQPDSISAGDHVADHPHASIGTGLRSFAVSVAIPGRGVASISEVVIVPDSPRVLRAWNLACSAEPPPNTTRAPPFPI
jgi:hypothetical protein